MYWSFTSLNGKDIRRVTVARIQILDLGEPGMFSKSEAFYDAIYGTMKDYAHETQQLHELI